jgi:hypothetical protein
LEQELRAVLAAEAGGEFSAGWARHRSNRDQHVLVTIQAAAWHQGGPSWSHPTGGQSIAQKIRLTGGLIMKKPGYGKGKNMGFWSHFHSF